MKFQQPGPQTVVISGGSVVVTNTVGIAGVVQSGDNPAVLLNAPTAVSGTPLAVATGAYNSVDIEAQCNTAAASGSLLLEWQTPAGIIDVQTFGVIAQPGLIRIQAPCVGASLTVVPTSSAGSLNVVVVGSYRGRADTAYYSSWTVAPGTGTIDGGINDGMQSWTLAVPNGTTQVSTFASASGPAVVGLFLPASATQWIVKLEDTATLDVLAGFAPLGVAGNATFLTTPVRLPRRPIRFTVSHNNAASQTITITLSYST